MKRAILYSLLTFWTLVMSYDVYKAEKSLSDHNKAKQETSAAKRAEEANVDNHQRGEQLVQSGQYEEALMHFNLALQKEDKNPDLYISRVGALLALNRVDEALLDMEAALTLRPEDERLLFARAFLYRRFGRAQDALNDLNRALEIRPDFVDALFGRASLHYTLQNFDKSVADFTHIIDAAPEMSEAYFNRARAYHMLDKVELAKKDMNEFLSKTNDDDLKQQGKALLEDWSDDS